MFSRNKHDSDTICGFNKYFNTTTNEADPHCEENYPIRSCQVTDSKIAVFQMIMRARRDLLARFVFAFTSAVLLCLPSVALAQTGQGIVSGIVSDPSGASIPHAAVAIRIADTNAI